MRRPLFRAPKNKKAANWRRVSDLLALHSSCWQLCRNGRPALDAILDVFTPDTGFQILKAASLILAIAAISAARNA